MMSGDDERDDPPFEFGDVWPDDKPFPLSDAECARLVRGHPVRWRSTLDERHRQLDDLGRGELRSRPGLGGGFTGEAQRVKRSGSARLCQAPRATLGAG